MAVYDPDQVAIPTGVLYTALLVRCAIGTYLLPWCFQRKYDGWKADDDP